MESIGFAEQAAQQDGLHLNAADGLPPIKVDPQRMEQVPGNLVSNALCHTPAGGSITLSGDYFPNGSVGAHMQVVLRVGDIGQGIAPADIAAHF